MFHLFSEDSLGNFILVTFRDVMCFSALKLVELKLLCVIQGPVNLSIFTVWR